MPRVMPGMHSPASPPPWAQRGRHPHPRRGPRLPPSCPQMAPPPWQRCTQAIGGRCADITHRRACRAPCPTRPNKQVKLPNAHSVMQDAAMQQPATLTHQSRRQLCPSCPCLRLRASRPRGCTHGNGDRTAVP
eukprot:17438-Pelagomonas_calceolata.AAC.7